MLISVDFWKSMHGLAMDSRTRAKRDQNEQMPSLLPFCQRPLQPRLKSYLDMFKSACSTNKLQQWLLPMG